MHRFIQLIARFRRDERGVFAVMFAVMAIVLIALGGAVVDYVSLEQTRNRAQIALDAAALALQPEIFETTYTTAQLKTMAEDLMIERLQLISGDMAWGVEAEVEDIEVDVDEGSLFLSARMRKPTMFVSLVGVPELDARIHSEATRRRLELEVVMVLDNSGSMANENRMPRLVDAAKCATYMLMFDAVVDAPGNRNTCIPAPGAQRLDDVRLSVVPFTMYVNVGAANANAAWIDTTGASSIHFDNFDNDDDEDRLTLTSGSYHFPTRQSLFSATGQAWRGCVEARPHTKSGTLSTEYLDTDDAAPTGGDRLYVPMFSPDMPNGIGNNNYISNGPAIVSSNYLNNIAQTTSNMYASAIPDSPAICDRPAQGVTRCDVVEERVRANSSSAWQAAYFKSGTVFASSPTNFISSSIYPNAFYGRLPPSCACRTPTYGNWTGTGNTQTRTGTCQRFVPLGLSQRELQERVCKYQQTLGTQAFTAGPNSQCTRTPILPLTNNPDTVIATIGNMVAEGGTNIHEGAVWGMRVLSPTAPFTQGAAVTSATSKVMIIMTDGENTAYQANNINGSSYHSAYGFPNNSMNPSTTSTSGGNVERMGPLSASNASLVNQMNQRTAQTCANAKDDEMGITIYTIGLATNKVEQSTEAVVKAMLTNCASTPDRASFPTQSSELKAVFAAIADDLADLRLAQ